MLRIFDRRNGTDNDPYSGIEMGAEVRDTLTGFEGIALARAEYLTGCNQVFVQPRSEKDNEMKTGHWFDVERIEKISDRKVQFSSRRSGADVPAPSVVGQREGA
jgi:hypothetical protein